MSAFDPSPGTHDDVILAQRMEKHMKAEEKERKLTEKARQKGERDAAGGTDPASEKGSIWGRLFGKEKRRKGREGGDDVIR